MVAEMAQPRPACAATPIIPPNACEVQDDKCDDHPCCLPELDSKDVIHQEQEDGVGRILRQLSDDLLDGFKFLNPTTLRDTNGNTVGKAEFED